MRPEYDWQDVTDMVTELQEGPSGALQFWRDMNRILGEGAEFQRRGQLIDLMRDPDTDFQRRSRSRR